MPSQRGDFDRARSESGLSLLEVSREPSFGKVRLPVVRFRLSGSAPY